MSYDTLFHSSLTKHLNVLLEQLDMSPFIGYTEPIKVQYFVQKLWDKALEIWTGY